MYFLLKNLIMKKTKSTACLKIVIAYLLITDTEVLLLLESSNKNEDELFAIEELIELM